MSFDDILVFCSRVISKLFCVRGNCYGNFNGQTTGGVTSTLKVAGDLKLFINDCNVFLARKLPLHRETIHSGTHPKPILQRREIWAESFN